MKTLIVIFALMASLCLHSTIINIPADYSTIQAGINSSANTDTVLVQPGTYIENIDFNGHLITLCSLFLTTADTSYIPLTVIDGGASGSVVSFLSGEDSTTVITGFTIQNGLNWGGGGGILCDSSDPVITHNIIKDNMADSGGGVKCISSNAKISYNDIHHNIYMSVLGNPGGGICCINDSDCIILFNRIHHNQNQDGGGIASFSSDPTINYNIIYENEAIDLGGGMRCVNSNAIITNNTFWGNTAVQAGGIYVDYGCNLTIVNNVLWNNSPNEITGNVTVTYSDIEGGFVGIGNINEYPLFVEPETGDFHLQEDSPCIDAGDPAYPFDPDGTISDMGALYFHQGSFLNADFSGIPLSGNTPLEVQFTDLSTGNILDWFWDFESDGVIDSNEQNPSHIYEQIGIYDVTLTITDEFEEDTEVKLNYVTVTDSTNVNNNIYSVQTSLIQNYPNPFNPITTISFSLTAKDAKNANIIIYNLKSQKIKQYSIFNPSGAGQAYQSSIVWDGTDENNKPVSSGIYFYKLKSGHFEQTRKMILLK